MDSEKATAVSPPAHPCVRAAQAYSTCSGVRLWLQPPLAKQEGSATTRRRSSPAGKRNGGDGPILSPCAAADRCACVRADTVIDNRFYVVFFL